MSAKLNKIKKVTPTKNTFWRGIWRLRYRFYVFVLIFVIPSLLHSSSYGVKANVPIDYGYEVTDSNYLAKKISKIPIPEETKKEIVKNESQKLEPKPNLNDRIIKDSLNIKDSKYYAVNKDGKDITKDFVDSSIFRTFFRNNRDNSKELKSLGMQFSIPSEIKKKNWLSYPKYNIQTPILYSGFEDLFDKNEGSYNFGKFKEQANQGSPVQDKLNDGIVHIGFTPQPGEIGNSYIVGHSSNFDYIVSDYKTVFKPIESISQPGEEFFIYDQDGRELKFCTYETKEIREEDIEEAYKDSEGKRTVTLQTSILRLKNGFLEPTHRWLTRGELCNLPSSPEVKK